MAVDEIFLQTRGRLVESAGFPDVLGTTVG